MKKSRKLRRTAGFAQRVRAGDCLIGTIVGCASIEVIETLAGTGLDWLFIDGEHGAIGLSDLTPILQAAGTCPCLIRIPGQDTVWIQRVLDAGAAGIIAPRVDDAGQAAAIVAAAKYPPQGRRGVGLARAHGFGLRFRPYLDRANTDTLVVIQAESRAAVENIDSIVAVPGVDAIFIGPYDLSASLGCTGEVHSRVVKDAVDRIMRACRRAGKVVGYFSGDAAGAKRVLSRGATLPVIGTDSLLLIGAVRAVLDQFKAMRRP
ncbi:MAG: 2,4-dihydroxyhept-2-ene-1,7-dioic acid aldolase [Gammaproteobacteria bacterium]|nr:2,4-dihydroxyhept-2-ene-1,7-dioic acid aldolase [Gammaproteobacteria bacterium]